MIRPGARLLIVTLGVLAGCTTQDASPPEAISDAGEPRLLLHGTYRYLADAGSFTECLTGEDWPVAQLGDNAALERGYLKVAEVPGGPVLVHLEGRVIPQPAMDGDSLVSALVVDRFLAAEPGASCAPQFTTGRGDTTR